MAWHCVAGSKKDPFSLKKTKPHQEHWGGRGGWSELSERGRGYSRRVRNLDKYFIFQGVKLSKFVVPRTPRELYSAVCSRQLFLSGSWASFQDPIKRPQIKDSLDSIPLIAWKAISWSCLKREVAQISLVSPESFCNVRLWLPNGLGLRHHGQP